MASPFPGMDPYLEDPSVWEEFHYLFIAECMYFLGERLPPNYLAKIQERVELIASDDEAARQIIPDVAVIDGSGRRPIRPEAASSGVTATALAPVVIPAAESIEIREGYIEIVRLPDYRLVTAIELLSPWNKFGEGLGEYRHKRRALIRRGVHIVEIDLLRRGHRSELARPLPAGDYYCLVFRADQQPDVGVYAWGLRDALPGIDIPLAAPNPDVRLELSTVVNTVYDRGRYRNKLRYDEPPPAPIAAEDAEWVEALAGGNSQK